jgi:diaminopimelate epimerase
MVLHNADGSRAEMSGNGIRCLAHALVRGRGTDRADLRIATDAGLREVSVRPDPDDDTATLWSTVDMGEVSPGREPAPSKATPPTSYTKAVSLELGNPHLVLLVEDPGSIDPAVDGPIWEARFPEGCNVHFASVIEPDRVVMRTWERGAGVTDACGTGATAAAAAVNGWGLTGERVSVEMPGGEVSVRLGATAILDGPSTWIADAEVTAVEADETR